MIGYLEGTLRVTPTGHVIVAGGVGWAVRLTRTGCDGERVAVWVTTVVRESDISLFGFPTVEEQLLFNALRCAPRVGPAAAMAVLADVGVHAAVHAIATKNAAALAVAKGIGKAAAKTIVDNVTIPAALLPLADIAAAPASPAVVAGDEYVETLIGFGYPPDAAARAVQTARRLGGDDEQILATALRHLSPAVA